MHAAYADYLLLRSQCTSHWQVLSINIIIKIQYNIIQFGKLAFCSWKVFVTRYGPHPASLARACLNVHSFCYGVNFLFLHLNGVLSVLFCRVQGFVNHANHGGNGHLAQN